MKWVNVTRTACAKNKKMAEFNLKKGYDIRLQGESTQEITDAPYPKTVAIKPSGFRGIKPKLLVKEGDEVKSGSPLFCNKIDEEHVFTSPVGGVIDSIQRGAKRVIDHIVVKTHANSAALEFDTYPQERLASLSRDEVMKQLRSSGLLAVFRQRPFDYVADPSATPRDIFITTFDSAPLSPNLALFIKGNEHFFQAGLDIASRLTSGRVHLSIDGRNENVPKAFNDAKNVTLHRFSGPHPAGCVGVQIHHIAPINGRNDVVWYCTISGLIILGKLFLEGKVSPEIIVSVAGSSAADRRYFRTIIGANIESIIRNNVQNEPVRYITGNVLTGTKVKKDGFLGFYDHMITIIPESTGPELVGWMLPGFKKESLYRTFLSSFIPGTKFVKDTKLNGGVRAFFASGFYEKVLPMNIYPIFLVKSILAGDIEEMEGLGIYEITEEELALCEYICPSKENIQRIIRDGLDLIEKEG